jgi:opacity protein-like surface antigen
MRGKAVFIVACVAIAAIAAAAQESRTSIALQGTGLFTSKSSGEDAFASPVSRHADTTGGFLLSYRYQLWSWLSAEGNYGMARNALQFSTASGDFSGNAWMHEVTTGFVVRLPASARFKFSPYVLAEGGALIFNPTSDGFRTAGGFSSNPAATRETKAAFIYGGGADFPITKRWSLRGEYRGLVHHSPDFGVSTLSTGKTTHTAQPSLGIVYHF